MRKEFAKLINKHLAYPKETSLEIADEFLAVIRKRVEELKKKNIDDVSYDNFMSQIYCQALNDVLEKLKG